MRKNIAKTASIINGPEELTGVVVTTPPESVTALPTEMKAATPTIATATIAKTIIGELSQQVSLSWLWKRRYLTYWEY